MMASNGSAYEVELFGSEGFVRRQCGKCGRFYWSLDPDKTTCGEPPCDEYSFIGNPSTPKKLSLHEMRELYLNFFERNGHTRVARYPIVARWRNDVFFTQASIYCFQPWVILGEVKPPANPLTISQTCVRFNDIDNVGKTGRHFTMFEMMAHHAFNTKDNFVYFKDRTVELCYRLLADELKIDPSRISFIEADWSGGGNSGPCFETLVDGIELSTLVFMMYEGAGSRKREMDMQVVDTGYGLERFTWITQGTSSAYEAVFGDVLSRLKDEAGVHVDEKILSEYSKVAGLMNVESRTDLRTLRSKVSERLGVTTKKLEAEIEPMEQLYTVCDHTRALMFMLQDGVLPSNVKEGYFARMLVRRTVRALKSLRLGIPLHDIVGLQIDFFQKDFPELKGNRGDVLKLACVEEDKYAKTLEKGRSIVARMDDRIKAEGGEISLEDLIDLYDSQGLTPDIVAEFSKLKVDVPDDFYVRVGERHEKPEEAAEEARATEVPKGLPETVLAYYEDRTVKNFTAKVLSVFDGNVVLDKTYFYPEGGGQETDLGTIASLPVARVVKSGNVVVHSIEGDASGIKEGDSVDCSIDWDRRLQLMQHHTSTHIVNGAARRVLGNHIWQTGAHKSVKGARLDLTHYASLGREELAEIESLSNKVVCEGREVKVTVMERNEAEGMYGFRLYQGGVVPGGEIRVVDVAGWDVEACGGIHLADTKDAGLIRITGSKRIQDGVVRIEFVAGEAAEKYAAERKKTAEKITKDASLSGEDLERVASTFSVKVSDLPKTIERFKREWLAQREELKGLEKRVEELTGQKCCHSVKYAEIPSCDSHESCAMIFEEWKTQRKELEMLRQQIADILYDELLERFRMDYVEIDGVRFVKELVRDMNVKSLSEVARRVVSSEGRLLLLVNVAGGKANVIVASSSGFDAAKIAGEFSSKIGGGSHGDGRLAVGGGCAKGIEGVLEAFKA
ncbi:MAG: alanine--tRNA ligase [Candidatus Altiarchaeota archaeon]|nr:alanine--tRNA ligase [Candidatus Altiarchaeota archaeon]